jgi:hypothetical protein
MWRELSQEDEEHAEGFSLRNKVRHLFKFEARRFFLSLKDWSNWSGG